MPGKIEISQINHVTTMVKDTARAMAFYNDLLGIKQIQSQVDNPAITWLQLENGVMVHLIETDEAPAKPGNVHHAFQVDDLEATRTSLESSGYEVLRGRNSLRRAGVLLHRRSRRQQRRVLHGVGLRAGAAATRLTSAGDECGQHHPGWVHGDRQEPRRTHRFPAYRTADDRSG